MTPQAMLIGVLLVLLLAVLALDLRAVGRPVGGTAGVLMLDSRQASHCDGCRRAVHLRARPWVMGAMAVIVIGLALGIGLAYLTDVPTGVPGALMCLSTVLAIVPLAFVNHRIAQRVREATRHVPGH